MKDYSLLLERILPWKFKHYFVNLKDYSNSQSYEVQLFFFFSVPCSQLSVPCSLKPKILYLTSMGIAINIITTDAVLEKGLIKSHDRYQKFLVVSRGRSGSNFFMNLLPKNCGLKPPVLRL